MATYPCYIVWNADTVSKWQQDQSEPHELGQTSEEIWFQTEGDHPFNSVKVHRLMVAPVENIHVFCAH